MTDNIQYKNELLKRRFFSYLRDSNGFSEDTLEAYEGAILLWQNIFPGEYLHTFTQKRATQFRDTLKKKKKPSGQEVSLTYCYTMLRHLRAFFKWLSVQPGFRTKVIASDVECLRLSKKENRIALQQKRKISPSVEEIKQVIENIVVESEVDMRDRAIISLMFLTGVRISAAYTLSLGSLDTRRLLLDQDPKQGVKTKNSKHIQTVFFPLGYKEAVGYILQWVDYLKNEKSFSNIDPLFPSSLKEGNLKKGIAQVGGHITRNFWKSSAGIRRIFKKHFEAAEVPYYHPHSLRDTVVKQFTGKNLTEEEKKALSQNLGHENVGTTFGAYGHGRMNEDHQFEIINKINLDAEDKPLNAETIRQIVEEAIKNKGPGVLEN